MKIAPFILLSLLLIVFSPCLSSALAPESNENAINSYMVLINRPGYVDSVDYDLRLLAPIVGSISEAKKVLLYHYSQLGFAARLTPKQVDRLSKKQGITIIQDQIYYLQKDGRFLK